MAIPVILGGAALIGGIKGIEYIVSGTDKLILSKELFEEINKKHELNKKYFKEKTSEVTEFLDKVGKKELEIFSSFGIFSNLIEKIQNRPIFEKYSNGRIEIPKYDPEKLKEISLGASLIINGLGDAVIGTAAGIAVAGVTTTIIGVLGIASTGVPIATLHGVAAANAIYAVLGGGALATGGGGMAAGIVALGGVALGIGLLATGFLFKKYTLSEYDKVEKILKDMNKSAEEMNKICKHLDQLKLVASKFNGTFVLTSRIYQEYLKKLYKIVETDQKKDWLLFTDEEKLITENTVLLVGLLYNLGKTRLLLKKSDKNELEEINSEEVKILIDDTKNILTKNNLRKE